jgi:hypothetical protein
LTSTSLRLVLIIKLKHKLKLKKIMNNTTDEVFNKVNNACREGDIKILNELLISIGKAKIHQIINENINY